MVEVVAEWTDGLEILIWILIEPGAMESAKAGELDEVVLHRLASVQFLPFRRSVHQ